MVWKKILLEGDAAVLGSFSPVNVNFSPASQGTTSVAARADHKHDVPEPLTEQLKAVNGAAANLGTSNTMVRGDHQHPMGTFVTNLYLGGFEAQDMLLEKLGSNPIFGSARIYFRTIDGHPYIGA